MSDNEPRCTTCGLPTHPDYGDPHECPAGFLTDSPSVPTTQGEVEPVRIQRKRTSGWKMPPNTVYVGRPTIFGNPFRATYLRDRQEWVVLDDNDVDYQPMYNSGPSAQRKAVELFIDDLTYWFGGRIKHDPKLREAIAGLRGKNLACWCPVGAVSERGPMPCHADFLLHLANREATP